MLTFCFIDLAFLHICSIGSISGYEYIIIQMLHPDSSIHVVDYFLSFSMASRTVESCLRSLRLGLSMVLCTPLAGLSTRHDARDVNT